MRGASLAVVFIVAVSNAAPVFAALPSETQNLVVRFEAERNRVESARKKISIERLFAMTDTLREYLLYGELLDRHDWSRKEHPPTIEDLSNDEYASLTEQLRGLTLNRDEVVIVEPDSGLFLPLARHRGLDADKEFMKIYFRTVPAAWPVYVIRQTDYSGCDDYGTGKLVSLYGQWQRYRSKYPQKYRRAATRQLEEVQNSIVGGGACACGGPESVAKEMQLFLKRFPNDPITSQVRDELNAIQEGRSAIRFNCSSG